VTGPARLAVDLGTTHTVAVVERAGQPPRALLFDGSPILPSGVFLSADGVVHTGRDAARLGAGEPERFEPHPKRRVDEGTVLLGTSEAGVAELLRAILVRVAEEARTAGVDPVGAVLTCPADWGAPRRAVLADAARRAGLGEVRLLDEPVAAATYCTQVVGQQVPAGGAVAVFDFGGGTLDVTVVRREPGGWRVAATGGLDDLGGLDVDEALVGHLGHLIAARDAAGWQRLTAPSTAAERRDRQAFWGEVRAAKEMLSRLTSAPVRVPGWEEPVHLTRDEVERVAGPLIARAVDETRRVLERSGVVSTQLNGVLLVGGSSRIPLVASRLHARLGVVPSVPEQPELPVAYGALANERLGPLAAAPVSAMPTSPPAGYAPGYPPGAPTSGVPVSGLPVSGLPVSGAPVSPPPGPGQPPGRIPTGQVPHPGPMPPWQAPHAAPKNSGKRTRRRVVAMLAAAALVAAVAVCGNYGVKTIGGLMTNLQKNAADDGFNLGDTLTGDGSGSSGTVNGELVQVGQPISLGGGASAVAAAGTTVYYARVAGQSTEVTAITAADNKPIWTSAVKIAGTEVFFTVLDELLLLDAQSAITHDGEDARAVLQRADGKVLWNAKRGPSRDIAFFGSEAVVEYTGYFQDYKLYRVDLKTGREIWKRNNISDSVLIDSHRAEPVRAWVGEAGPASGAGTLPPDEYRHYDSLSASPESMVQITDDQRIQVVNMKDGSTKGQSGPDVGRIEDEFWTAFDNQVVGLLNSQASAQPTVAAFGLSDFAEKWRLPLEAGETIDQIKPCGDHRVCIAVDSSHDNYRTVAVDTTTGKVAWTVKSESAQDDKWYATPKALLWGDQTFDTVGDGKLLRLDGKEIAILDRATVQMTRNGRAFATNYSGQGGSVVQVWDIATGKLTRSVSIGDGFPSKAAFDGTLGALIDDKGVLKMFEVKSLG
jgi:molecular chaperone HscA